MTNYQYLILNLLNGETEEQKYEHLKSVLGLLDSVAMPRRGSIEEDWDIQDVSNMIHEQKLLSTTLEYHERNS